MLRTGFIHSKQNIEIEDNMEQKFSNIRLSALKQTLPLIQGVFTNYPDDK